MEVYRLCNQAFTDLNGQGGLYASGRWHKRGLPILYSASSRALAILERFVHEDFNDLPKLKMLTIWLPDDISIQQLTTAQLPLGWDNINDQAQQISQQIGHDWLKRQGSAVLKVPSAFVQDEFNYLLNPQHQDHAKIQIVDQRNYYYDQRLQVMVR